MAKVSKKDILSKVKKEEKENAKENVTFRINSMVLEKFKASCKSEDVSISVVVERMLRDYIGE